MAGHLTGEALDAAERAIEALGRRDPAGARMAVAVAVEVDRTPAVSRLADAVFLAAWRLEQDEEIDEATWNHLSDVVGPGPLQGLVEQARGEVR